MKTTYGATAEGWIGLVAFPYSCSCKVVIRVRQGSKPFPSVRIRALFQSALQVCLIPVKCFEKYFHPHYCAKIRHYSALQRHYSYISFPHMLFAAPASETCAMIRPFTRRGNSNFSCARFFDRTQNALGNPCKIDCGGFGFTGCR